MTEEDLAARLRDGLRQRQNDALFVPDREGPLDKPAKWRPEREPKRRCSTGKTVFNSVRHARYFLEQLHRKIEQGEDSRDYIPVYVAPRCPKCKGFHVTSKIPRQVRGEGGHAPRLPRR